MDSVKNIWVKLAGFLKTKKALLIGIIVVSVLVPLSVFVLIGSIYTKDQPKVVPPEVRKEVRGTIKEDIVEPIAKIFPGVGQPIANAAYKEPSNNVRPNLSNGINQSDPTADWKVYKDEKLGFEIKYPGSYAVDRSGDIFGVVKTDNNDLGLWFYGNSSTSEISNWWKEEKKKYGANFQEERLLINGLDVLKATTEEGLGESHYIVKVNNGIVDILSIGGEDNEEIISTIKTQSL
jgi:hypothetical protein